MSEVVNVLVAFAVIVLVFRWATSGKDSSADGQSPAAILGFRPKTVTPEQVDAVHSMFPDIPADNIRYDLLRTGSVQLTSNKILERGFLPAPPATYFRVYPRAAQNDAPRPAAANAAPAAAAPSHQESLIKRFNLEDRVVDTSNPTPAEAPHKWEADPAKREAGLKERKARMILAARE
ncbi:hypothetical protein PHLGIDRAFT_111029 [Phlebiopsis gigantea 11061_1 CR5-6]|uniref:CUE domain-containing protein n=1 Tax=Phlebiopsis gigantea (strain 11061_1 CR5-6) TaxID=745531 RepID=A0A0C3RSH7_PHLG1|nr:hypothetical protein PHLGIDRAFT_111029 [Phlebiopsis gigantea 11061_1 CR5-6]